MGIRVLDNVPLAPLTTFELGGAARHFVEARSEEEMLEALAWAARAGVVAHVLGGGSNVIVPDAGVDGLVVRAAARGLRFVAADDLVICAAAAGEPWDAVVEAAVGRDLAGIECLSGIPGSAGATPIQNVGAYGQEVADTIRAVRAYDRAAGTIVEVGAAACGFAYRDSAFKRQPQRHVVLSVSYALRPGGAPGLRYPEIKAALAANPRPTLGEVRAAVLAVRRRKSMVLDPADPNRRSAGSFFTNPIVPESVAEAVVARAVAEGLVREGAEVPRFAAGPGRVKLAAGWLIERAGITKGLRQGAVGVSSKHTLALVHHGGGTTAALLALARQVRETVRARFGVTLAPEPVILGAQPGGDPLAG